ncbi:MAG: hypothetical protein HY268_25945 [Deltaproteobacteria bacterium]|nr:hypothetical protein [Deltaproteobacteria bacterium]
MATNGKRPRDLLAERINRLDKQGAETNKRLDQVVAILGGIANTLVGQGRELERHSQLLERHNQLLEQHSQILQALTERLDRFADAVIIGRTRDTERVGELERRVETLERQVFRGTLPPQS